MGVAICGACELSASARALREQPRGRRRVRRARALREQPRGRRRVRRARALREQPCVLLEILILPLEILLDGF